MADSPQLEAEGVVRLSIHCAGFAQEGLPVLSVEVHHALNDIPWARLVLVDGDMPNGSVPLSDGELFKPGGDITVKAGYRDDEETIFTGIVVHHGFRISGDNGGHLIVECRARACKMTLSRQTAHHVNQTDGKIIQTLIGNAGLSASVAPTNIDHEALVQYDCSDWDFMLARADAMGLLVNVDGDTVSVQPPQVHAAAALTVTWGVDLIDFEADIDASTQWAAVQATSWNPKEQSLLHSMAATSTALATQGDLQGAALAVEAAPAILALQTCTPQPREVLNAWAKAVQVKAALARVRGRMSFQGSALARAGALVELAGVGKRFSGTVLLSSVEHEFKDGNWISRAEFGLDAKWHVQQPGLLAATNGGLLPGVRGLQIGVVLKLDGDPEEEHRILVRLPACQAATEGIWARLLHPHASSGFGSFFLPEVGDEVLLGHLNQDPCHPVVLGSLYSSSRPPTYPLTAENDIKAVVTRSRHKIEFNDADKLITVTTPGNNQLVFNDQDKAIEITDQSGNFIRLSEAGIALDSPNDITLMAKGGITLDAVGAISVHSKADVTLDGLNVACQAQVGVFATGAASAELSASGQTTVRGAVVMIN